MSQLSSSDTVVAGSTTNRGRGNQYAWYSFVTPYLWREMNLSLSLRKDQLAAAGFRINKLVLPRSQVWGFQDVNGKLKLSRHVDDAVTSGNQLFFIWSEGCHNRRVFNLLEQIWVGLYKKHTPPLTVKDGAVVWNSVSTGEQNSADAISKVYQLPSHLLISILGGSIGLRNVRMLADKIQLDEMLCKANRDYIPWTEHIRMDDPKWQRLVTLSLTPATGSGAGDEGEEYVIIKPAGGQQQRGMLVTIRDKSNVPQVIAHMQSKDHEGGPYRNWVCQQYVRHPFCVSGLDAGTLGPAFAPDGSVPTDLPMDNDNNDEEEEEEEEEEEDEGDDAPGTSKEGRRSTADVDSPPGMDPSTGAGHDNDASSSQVVLSSATAVSGSSPTGTATSGGGIRGKAGGIASSASASGANPPNKRPGTGLGPPPPAGGANGGTGVGFMRLKKPAVPVGISIVGPVAAEQVLAGPGQLPSDSGIPVDGKSQYKVHFRVYALVVHDALGELVGGGPGQGAPYLPFSTYICKLVKTYHSKKPYVASSTEYDSSISKYLTMRMAHEYIDEKKFTVMFAQFKAIIKDTVELSLHMGGFTPTGMARISFQLLGYDFLFDTKRNKVILLEANVNCGQGVMKGKVMIPQGMSKDEYSQLRAYWTLRFRRPLVESIMSIVVDQHFLGGKVGAGIGKDTCFVKLGDLRRTGSWQNVVQSRVEQLAKDEWYKVNTPRCTFGGRSPTKESGKVATGGGGAGSTGAGFNNASSSGSNAVTSSNSGGGLRGSDGSVSSRYVNNMGRRVTWGGSSAKEKAWVGSGNPMVHGYTAFNGFGPTNNNSNGYLPGMLGLGAHGLSRLTQLQQVDRRGGGYSQYLVQGLASQAAADELKPMLRPYNDDSSYVSASGNGYAGNGNSNGRHGSAAAGPPVPPLRFGVPTHGNTVMVVDVSDDVFSFDGSSATATVVASSSSSSPSHPSPVMMTIPMVNCSLTLPDEQIPYHQRSARDRDYRASATSAVPDGSGEKAEKGEKGLINSIGAVAGGNKGGNTGGHSPFSAQAIGKYPQPLLLQQQQQEKNLQRQQHQQQHQQQDLIQQLQHLQIQQLQLHFQQQELQRLHLSQMGGHQNQHQHPIGGARPVGGPSSLNAHLAALANGSGAYSSKAAAASLPTHPVGGYLPHPPPQSLRHGNGLSGTHTNGLSGLAALTGLGAGPTKEALITQLETNLVHFHRSQDVMSTISELVSSLAVNGNGQGSGGAGKGPTEITSATAFLNGADALPDSMGTTNKSRVGGNPGQWPASILASGRMRTPPVNGVNDPVTASSLNFGGLGNAGTTRNPGGGAGIHNGSIWSAEKQQRLFDLLQKHQQQQTRPLWSREKAVNYGVAPSSSSEPPLQQQPRRARVGKIYGTGHVMVGRVKAGPVTLPSGFTAYATGKDASIGGPRSARSFH